MLKAVGDESRAESSEPLKSFRLGPRESLKVMRQMIKMPIQLLRDDFFELVRVVKVPRASGLTIADVAQDMAAREPSWMLCLSAPKLVKLVSLPFAAC